MHSTRTVSHLICFRGLLLLGWFAASPVQADDSCFKFFSIGTAVKVGLRNTCDEEKIAVISFVYGGGKHEEKEFSVPGKSSIEIDTTGSQKTEIIDHKDKKNKPNQHKIMKRWLLIAVSALVAALLSSPSVFADEAYRKVVEQKVITIVAEHLNKEASKVTLSTSWKSIPRDQRYEIDESLIQEFHFTQDTFSKILEYAVTVGDVSRIIYRTQMPAGDDN